MEISIPIENAFYFAPESKKLAVVFAGLATATIVAYLGKKIHSHYKTKNEQKNEQKQLIAARNIVSDLKEIFLTKDNSSKNFVLSNPLKALMYTAALKIFCLIFSSVLPLLAYGAFWGSVLMIDLLIVKNPKPFLDALSKNVPILNLAVQFFGNNK